MLRLYFPQATRPTDRWCLQDVTNALTATLAWMVSAAVVVVPVLAYLISILNQASQVLPAGRTTALLSVVVLLLSGISHGLSAFLATVRGSPPGEP